MAKKQNETQLFPEEELRIYEAISKGGGLKARELSRETGIGRSEINRLLVS